jgi:pullulanase/glycogen debranching enzyme
MSTQPFENAMNPWYFMYQPVSYNLDGRMGTREKLKDLIQTCRGFGVRVYIDAVLNHFTGAGNDHNQHRQPMLNGVIKQVVHRLRDNHHFIHMRLLINTMSIQGNHLQMNFQVLLLVRKIFIVIDLLIHGVIYLF